MRADLFDVPIGDITYRAEEPLVKDGLKVTLTVLDPGAAPGTATGSTSTALAPARSTPRPPACPCAIS
jgi:hypothetical protein